MDGPIQRAGAWWQRHGGQWYRWNEGNKQWERQTGGPPAPPRPSGRPASSPTRASASTVRTSATAVKTRPRTTRATTERDDSRFTETWATSKARPAQVKAEELPDWYPDLNKPEPKAKTSPLMIRLIVFLVAAAVSATGYFGLKGAGSGDPQTAFTPLAGYEYQDVPPEVLEAARTALEMNGADEVIDDLAARALVRAGQPVGAVLAYAVPPELFAEEGEAAFEFALQQTPGVTYQKVPRDGTMMYELTMPGAAQATFFDEQDGLLIQVVAEDTSVMRDASGQLAKANL